MAAAAVPKAVQWLSGVLAGLLIDLALDAARDGVLERPRRPPVMPGPIWRDLMKEYIRVCECEEDPELIEVCRDRMLRILEGNATSGTRRRSR